MVLLPQLITLLFEIEGATSTSYANSGTVLAYIYGNVLIVDNGNCCSPQKFQKRARKDYARLHAQGLTLQENMSVDSEVEDGQILDSPLQLMAEGEDFPGESVTTSSHFTEAKFSEGTNDDDTVLDYEEDVQDGEMGDNSDRGSDTSPNEGDSDEEWQAQQQIMQLNKEKRDRARRKLERQRQMAQVKLQEEKEKEELRRMEMEIRDLNQQRFAENNSKFSINKSNLKASTQLTVKQSKTNKKIQNSCQSRVKAMRTGNDNNCNYVNKHSRPHVKFKDVNQLKSKKLVEDVTLDTLERVQQWLDSSVDTEEEGAEPDVTIDNNNSCFSSYLPRRVVCEQRRVVEQGAEPQQREPERRRQVVRKQDQEESTRMQQPD